MFKGPVKNIVDAGRLAKVDIHGESKQTVYVYADGWQSCLTTLSKAVADSLDVPAPIIQAALGAAPGSAPEVQASGRSQVCAGTEYEFVSERGSPGAGPKPDSSLSLQRHLVTDVDQRDITGGPSVH